MPTLKYKDPVTGEYKSDIHVVGAVSSVNGKTGVVELTNSDIPNAITDVQVNGTSVVTDGVANVPIAAANTHGVLKAGNPNYGTLINDAGDLFIMPSTNAVIKNRVAGDGYSTDANNRCPIVPSHLDYAVKAAMTDGRGAAWTPAEQAAARERMGAASHNWKTKQEFTLGDAYADHSAFFTLNIDEENVSEIVIYLLNNGGAGGNNYWSARGNGVIFGNLISCYFDSTAAMSISRFVGAGDITLYECDATSNGYAVTRKCGAINAKITDIKTLVTSLNGETAVLGAGTKIVVLIK